MSEFLLALLKQKHIFFHIILQNLNRQMTERQTYRQKDRKQIVTKKHRWTDQQKHRQSDRWTIRQLDRQIGRQKNRLTDRQTETQIDR